MPKIVIPPETLALMKEAYDGGRTLEAVAAIGGVGKSYVSRNIPTWGWTHRRPELTRDGLARGGVPVAPLPPPDEDASLRERLERLLAHRIGALEAAASSRRPAAAEANARALAVNTRTLALLRRLPAEVDENGAADDEPPPRTLAELRDELRRHLERIAGEERSRRLRERTQPPRMRGDAPPLADPLPGKPASP